MRQLMLATAVWMAVLPAVKACPFCNETGQTLVQDVMSAAVVLYGWTKNARLDPKEYGKGSTDLEIEVILKSHDSLGKAKVVTIPKYLPQVDPKKPMKTLVFGDVYMNKIDYFKGTPYKADSRVATYLQSMLALKDKDVASRLKVAFEYLDDSDDDVSKDAVMEFGNADYKDMRAVTEKFPASKIIGWLKDPGVPVSRMGLYASMLGHCGKPEDASVLQAILDDPGRQFIGGLDGVYAGLTLLKPDHGWKTITDTLADGNREFLVRFAARNAVRFLWEYRPDVISKECIAEGMTVMLNNADIADLATEDFRRWQYWKVGDQILAMLGKKSHESLLIRRAVLRYFLQCPAKECAAGAAWLAKQRIENPKWVDDVEALLNAESNIPVPNKPK